MQYDQAVDYVKKNINGAYEQAMMLKDMGIINDKSEIVAKILKLLSIGYQRKTGDNLSPEAIAILKEKAEAMVK